MVELEFKNKELEANLVTLKLKHSQDQLEIENRLQESMSFSQKLLIESIEKNAELNDLKEKLMKCRVLKEPDVIELESESTEENTDQRLLEEKLQIPASFNHKQQTEITEIDDVYDRQPAIWTTDDLNKPAFAMKSFELDHNYHKTSKRYHGTTASPDESFVAPLSKRKKVDVLDTREL
jgi:hypothetical protein